MSKSILLIGGGHAHVSALRKYRQNPSSKVQICLVSKKTRSAYSGRVPGFVAGHYDRNDVMVDLVRECQAANTAFSEDEIVAIDPNHKLATGQSGQIYAFDACAIDVGISSAPKQPSPAPKGFAAKPMEAFVKTWASIRDDLPPGIAVIGGGLGGVELSLAIAHYITMRNPNRDAGLHLIDRGRILSDAPQSLRRALLKQLARAGVAIHEHARIAHHANNLMTLQTGEAFGISQTVWTIGAQPYEWLAECGLATRDGFPLVDRSLQSVSHPGIFVAGDAAAHCDTTLPKAGVHAVRQGPILMHNLMASVTGGDLRDYNPQKDYLKLVSLGRKSAIAEKWGVTLHLPGLWGLKSWIDGRFVQA